MSRRVKLEKHFVSDEDLVLPENKEYLQRNPQRLTPSVMRMLEEQALREAEGTANRSIDIAMGDELEDELEEREELRNYAEELQFSSVAEMEEFENKFIAGDDDSVEEMSIDADDEAELEDIFSDDSDSGSDSGSGSSS